MALKNRKFCRKMKRSYKKKCGQKSKSKRRSRKHTTVRSVGFTPSLDIKLRHVSLFYPILAISGSTLYSYCTGINDVDLVVAGNQRPMYFSQLTSIYDKWFVKGFRYSIRIINRGNGADINPIMVNVQIRDVITMDTSPTIAAQRWYDKDYQCSQGLTTIKGYVPVGQPFGLSRKRCYNDEQFYGSATLNPVKMAYLHVLVQNPFSTTTAYVLRAELTYDVHFIELTHIAAS
jgi:hypothetical protein